jgi:hypothetical protein
MGGMSQDAVDALVKLLDLEPIEVNLFRGLSPDEDRQRVFGGQVAGQALVAAARSVEPGRSVHSLHAHKPRRRQLPAVTRTKTHLEQRKELTAEDAERMRKQGPIKRLCVLREHCGEFRFF